MILPTSDLPARRPLRRALLSALALGAAGLGGFVVWKARSVAWELTDPPFYRAQPLARVQGTYADLARGGEGDPGGTWSVAEVEGLQLWTLKRAKPSPGIVLLLHGFGDDRWGTSPALKWFPDLDAAIFTYRRRDDALRAGRGPEPFVTFGARESEEVVRVVRHLEACGWPRERIVLMGRSLGASVGLLALARLEREGGPLGGLIWEGAPASSRDFAERLVRGPKDRFWHPVLAPPIGALAARWAAQRAAYDPLDTDVLKVLGNRSFRTPALAILATQDRLAPPEIQARITRHFPQGRVLSVPTWHLNAAQVLGPDYPRAVREATERWLKRPRGPEGPRAEPGNP
ncbi:MAG: Alpha/beta hydrolase family protein [Acidobacteria bacterium ADurb.Bin340]|nr:MAG: Alpha/beta hydrolase family protein [Acidobacteria bacterium ADurb.Bin340]